MFQRTNCCPVCQGELENERHTYVLATRERDEIDTCIVGSECGHFCKRFPVVVFDLDNVVEFATLAGDFTGTFEIVVMGIVDLSNALLGTRSVPRTSFERTARPHVQAQAPSRVLRAAAQLGRYAGVTAASYSEAASYAEEALAGQTAEDPRTRGWLVGMTITGVDEDDLEEDIPLRQSISFPGTHFVSGRILFPDGEEDEDTPSSED